MPLHVRMFARDPDEAHRAVTPLELFFDLAFVVAVGSAASSLHHGLVEGHAADALVMYPLVFFAIWWAWMNFAWFASAYDTDDALYRLAVFVQVAGVLCIAIGIPRAFTGHDFAVIALGYVVMRLALVAQWLRAAGAHPERRTAALRYAVGITVVQIGWVLWLAAPGALFYVGFVVLAAAELAVPLWAEAAGRTPWHPGHIAERYGLFTIIVLGEAMLGATVAVQAALDDGTRVADLAAVMVGGLLIVFSLWWFYFDMPAGQVVARARRAFNERLTGAFSWGYSHYLVFASAAAVGTGIAISVDQVTHHSELTDLQAGFTLTVPVCLYLLSVWGIHFRQKPASFAHSYAVPVTALLILAGTFTPVPVFTTGVLVAVLVAIGAMVAGVSETP